MAPGAVEREHQQPRRALLIRVFRDQGLELTDDLHVMPEPELGVRLLDLCRQKELAQATDVVTLRPLEDDIRKRRTTPERKRALPELDRRVEWSGSRGLDQSLELREVQSLRLDLQPVPGRLRLDDAVAELLPQRVHVALDELLGGRRRCFPP